MQPTETLTVPVETLALSPGASPKSRSRSRRKGQLQVHDASLGTLPTLAELRAQARFVVGEQAEILREAIERLRAKLTATKVNRLVVRDGRDLERVEEFVDEDTVAQLRAIQTVFELLGANTPKQSSTSGPTGKVEVNIRFADMPAPSAPVVVEVSGKRVE